ncbi:MAG: hypothetical protein AB7J13_00675 [Pyrinomonadaceae bacterium]
MLRFNLFVMLLASLAIGYRVEAQSDIGNATVLWEHVIEAKGGRDRLRAVTSMVVWSDAVSRSKKFGIRIVNVYDFPDRTWSWTDQRPGPFGLRVSMYDWRARKMYSITDSSPDFEGLLPISNNMPSTNLAGLVPELLETRWNAPEPKRSYQLTIDGRSFWRIETTLNSKRCDFVIDPKTKLPVEFIGYNEDGVETNRMRFDGYETWSGIQMATKVTFVSSGGNIEYKRRYLFNVDVDESIFSSPPPFEIGSEAWKSKKAGSR